MEKEFSKSPEDDCKVSEICSKRKKALEKKAESEAIALRKEMDVSWANGEHKGCPVELTIALSHLPLTWLQEGGAQLRDVLFNKGLDGVDIWLCGHAHHSQLYYTNDDGRSVLMLMTGIGRKERATDRQRYSIYRIGIERNSCSVKVRVTENGITFDTERIGDDIKQDKLYDYACFPLHNRMAGALLRLNASNLAISKGFLLDSSAFDLIRNVSLRMSVLRERLSEETHKQIDLVFRALESSEKKLGWNPREVASQNGTMEEMDDFQVSVFNNAVQDTAAFRDLLRIICSCIVETFSRPMPGACVSTNDYASDPVFKKIKWRAHFRRYACSSLTLLKSEIKDDRFYVCTTNVEDCQMQPVPWNEFLKAVYDHKEKQMVFSAGEYENIIKTDWDDFLTAVPDIPENKFEYNRLQVPQIRPLLTFGLSLKGACAKSECMAARMLYVLEYLNLNKVITYVIQLFVSEVPVQFNKVIKAIKVS